MAESRSYQQEGRLFSAAFLDSATNTLFAFGKLRNSSTSENPYGFEKGDIVLYPDSIYASRIASISSELPLVFNEEVKAFIDLYAFREKELTERMLGKSQLYYPFIEQVLHQKKLPNDLKNLTMIESALRPEAESGMTAAGLWQIRYGTGLTLGLTIDSYVDERRDPYASTMAGVTYLEELYQLYGDWWLAIAAYNCGPGNVNKAIVKAGGIRNYWKISPYLPQETRSYVPAFIAMVYIYHFQEEHNLWPKPPALSFNAVDTVRIYQEITFEEITGLTGVSTEELAFLNPSLIQGVVPASKEGYALVLPVNKLAVFEQHARKELLQGRNMEREVLLTAQVTKEKKEVIPRQNNLVRIIHKIEAGNTLEGISRLYGCAVKDIMDWNALYDPVLKIGKELKIYIPEAKANQLQASMASSDFSSSSSGSE